MKFLFPSYCDRAAECLTRLEIKAPFAVLYLPGKHSMLNNQWVVGVALAFYVIEFAEDKIPLLDSAWDIVHTLIQIPASAALAAA